MDNIKELERNRGKVTIKKCPGVQEILKTGYVLRSWEDFVFREEDGFLYVNWLMTIVIIRMDILYTA